MESPTTPPAGRQQLQVRNSHARRKPRQLVRRRLALPGVSGYLFCCGCERASLWRLPTTLRQRGDQTPAQKALLAAVIRLAPVRSGTPLILALPADWARGLVEIGAVPNLATLSEAGGVFVALWQLPAVPAAVESELGRLWHSYRQLVCRPGDTRAKSL